MILHTEINDTNLRSRIRQKEICFGGNNKLKIYGTLQYSSGRRMLKKNRVFFASETEAANNGFRPWGHCMKSKYQNWKNGPVQ